MLAVIGPNADEWTMLLGNYNGLPSKAITPLEGIREKLGSGTKVIYAKGCELAEGLPTLCQIPATALSHGGAPGLQADYYSDRTFQEKYCLPRKRPELDDNWVATAHHGKT